MLLDPIGELKKQLQADLLIFWDKQIKEDLNWFPVLFPKDIVALLEDQLKPLIQAEAVRSRRCSAPAGKNIPTEYGREKKMRKWRIHFEVDFNYLIFCF